MIRKLINRIFGRKAAVPATDAIGVSHGAKSDVRTHASATPKARRAARASRGKLAGPVMVPSSVHGIDPKGVSANATRVTKTLQDAGFKAFVVGGAVRDLLLQVRPKDFDVATNATPEEIQRLFRRAHIIGRRFRLVHVMFGADTIEVSTFRAASDQAVPVPAAAPHAIAARQEVAEAPVVIQVPMGASGRHVGNDSGNDAGRDGGRRRRGGPRDGDAGQRTADEHGRVLRDNVFGSQEEDAARRDFTVNALFYDPATQSVIDYHDGVADLKARTLRMIGDPEKRYREDPVRMLRAVRFAAKLQFEIDEATREPIARLAPLLDNVPPARLFDEMLKLLLSGHALACLKRLRAEGLHHGMLPLLDVVFEQPLGERFVTLALENTDERIRVGKPTTPSFLFASLMWHEVLQRWNEGKARGEVSLVALGTAMDEVLDAQTETLAIQRRYTADMREIWGLQPRLERRVGRSPWRVLEHPRFRAGYDFLLLRAAAGEIDPSLGDWWTRFIDADDAGREALQAEPGVADGAVGGAKRKRRRKKKVGDDGATLVGDGTPDEDGHGEIESATRPHAEVAPADPVDAEAAPKPRRPRVRRPAADAAAPDRPVEPAE